MDKLMEEPGPASVSDPGSRSKRYIDRICLWLGLMVYLASFFLPAVSDEHSSEPGWLCALFALMAPWGHLSVSSLLLLACGWINPLALTYLCLRVRPGDGSMLRGLAIAELALIPLTWIFIALEGYGVEIGHFVWIAGLLLMMGHEAILGRKYETT